MYQLRFLLFHLFWLCGFSLFFLVSLARSVSILFTLSDNQLLGFFLEFFYFLISILFISSLIIIPNKKPQELVIWKSKQNWHTSGQAHQEEEREPT